jgi:hypothetical protein
MLGRITLNCVFDKWCVDKWTVMDWFRIVLALGFVGKCNKQAELNSCFNDTNSVVNLISVCFSLALKVLQT